MVLALDLDGTLLTEQETVSSANKAALEEAVANGIQPTIATGRILHNKVYALMGELGIRLPVATLNGGAIISPKGQLLHSFPIPEDDMRWLVSQAELDGLDYWGCTLDRVIHGAGIKDSEIIGTIINATFRAQSPQQMVAFRQKVQEVNRFNLTWPDDYHMVANAKGINKATALEIICREYGLTSEHVAAIGDGINDFEMLAWAEHSFAMGNASEALKAVARETTLEYHEDGVAFAVQRLLQQVIT